ncbi:class I SAM-dependent methyltransferase [Candidatus Fermentibacterales bacterium]|nr:class I SAM-dependent methyltransferase [Candidatus Fermentibacterales bacterium]
MRPGEGHGHWFEDDLFWESHWPLMFPEEVMEAASGQVDQLVALTSARSGEKVLDLCCGPGRHSIELARLGFRVTGVDRTRAFVEAAGKSALEQGLDIEWVECDMRDFERANGFDIAVSMYTSFGYFEDVADDLRVLANVRRSLRPGGRLLIEIMGKEVLARIFQERGWSEHDGLVQLQERRVTDNWSMMHNRWILFPREGGEPREYVVRHRIYSAVELIGLLERAGFEDCSAFGGLDGSAYDQNAGRLVVLGRVSV